MNVQGNASDAPGLFAAATLKQHMRRSTVFLSGVEDRVAPRLSDIRRRLGYA